jgi:hypothetical protein
MRRALIAATAALLLATAGCNIEPTNISGTVTSRSMQFNAATKHWQYYLTVNGQTFRVYFQTYNACTTGKQYPTCKN